MGESTLKNYIGLELLECEGWKCVSVCTCTGLEVSVYIQLLEMCTCECVCVYVKQDRSEMEGQLTRRWMVEVGWRVGGRHRKKNFKNSYMHLPNYGRHLSTS